MCAGGNDGDAGPAPVRFNVAACARLRSRRATPAMGGFRFGDHGRFRRTVVLCRPGPQISEHLLSAENGDACISPGECMAVSPQDLAHGGGLESGSDSTTAGEACSRRVVGIVGGYDHVGTDDSLSDVLVRLRERSAFADRQYTHGLLRRPNVTA